MTNKDIIEFYQVIFKLKNLKRTGWVLKNIENPESVAEHSFALALLTMLITSRMKDIDQLKAVKMALIHDIGEAEIGDIVISDGEKILNDRTEKVANERKALAKILKFLDTEDYIKLYDEYEDQQTPEAKLVKQLDKIEMGLQALTYEKQENKSLESFFINTRAAINSDDLKELLKEIELLRPAKA